MHNHRDTFPAPSKGWPTFDEDGRIVKDEEDQDEDRIDTVQPD